MENNNLPDFLIVGAAKAGTTSLYKYLDLNDSICMSKIKEPKFFLFWLIKYILMDQEKMKFLRIL